MKKRLLRHVTGLACLSVLSPGLQGQEIRNVPTKITQAVVYLQGAQVTRTGSTSLNAGTNYLVFGELPYQMDPSSIQLSGTGSFTLLSVSHQYNYLNSQKKSEEVKRLQQQREELQEKLNMENALSEVYQAEENMLKANQDIKGAQNGLSVSELKNAVDYFRTRLTDIKTKRIEQAKKIKKLQEEIAKLDGQISQLNSLSSLPSSEVVVTLLAKNATQASFTLSYYFRDAGWTPSYDIQVNNITTPAVLIYKANVFQRSDEAWENVKLWLSTANPTLGGNRPVLQPWYLNAYVPVITKKRTLSRAMPADASAEPLAAKAAEMKTEEETPMEQLQTEIQSRTTSFLYKINALCDIPGNGKPFTLTINENSIPARYEYYCVPKLDKDAFLLAHITGWQEYNLLNGEVNLFFEGSYVGKSYLDVASTADTLSLSLGRDKDIVIDRTIEKNISGKTLTGTRRKVEKAWAITVRNNKKTAVDIVIEDQYPIAANTQIKVENIEHKGAEWNSVTGKLTWRLTLQPAESKKVGFHYSVEYPKDMQVIVE